jgi:hypothetical protein
MIVAHLATWEMSGNMRSELVETQLEFIEFLPGNVFFPEKIKIKNISVRTSHFFIAAILKQALAYTGSTTCQWHLACSPRRVQGAHGCDLSSKKTSKSASASSTATGADVESAYLSHFILRLLHSKKMYSGIMNNAACRIGGEGQ